MPAAFMSVINKAGIKEDILIPCTCRNRDNKYNPSVRIYFTLIREDIEYFSSLQE